MVVYTMNYKDKKRIQLLSYIASKLNEDSPLKEKLIKLVYLADKLFLLKYGHTITGDRLIAMQRGTACSQTLNIMNEKLEYIDEPSIDYLNSLFEISKGKTGATTNLQLKPDALIETSCISKRELEILDYIVELFGNKRQNQLSEYTHSFPEWKRFEKEFEKDSESGFDIEILDLFNLDFSQDDPLLRNLDFKTIENSMAVLKGEF